MGTHSFQHDAAELLGQRRLEERNGADANKLAAIDQKIGELIRREKDTDEYFSVDDAARRLGHSPVTIDMVTRGEDYRGMEPHDEARAFGLYIVVLDGPAAAHFVTTQQARVVRSISGFDESDAALRSHLSPSVFAVEGRLDPPNMLWELDTGEWVGVSHTQVGYGGEGPQLAAEALIAAGVAEDLAEEISWYRFCDAVDVTDPQTWETSRIWPVEGRSWPQLVHGDITVAWGPGMPRRGYSHRLRLTSPTLTRPDSTRLAMPRQVGSSGSTSSTRRIFPYGQSLRCPVRRGCSTMRRRPRHTGSG